MGGFLDRIKNWWLQSTQSQKITTIGGSVLTLLLLAGIFSFASKPKFGLLYGGLSATDQASIVEQVQSMGIPVNYDVSGRVEVPEDMIAKVRMDINKAGKAPKSAHLGTENLGDMNLYTTPAVERERLKAIAEGELARSIETNPGVKSARVHITLGDPSPFAEQQRPPTASISLMTAGPGSVSRDSARGIAMLVANSVDGLDMNHVVVLDEKAVPIYDGAQLSGADSVASNKLEMEQTLARKEEQRLQTNLDSIFGVGATKVSVRCEVNLDEKRVKENKRVVGKGAAVKSMKETMSGDQTNGGPAGAASNLGAPATPDNKGNNNYTSKVEQVEPNVTETQTETNKSLGTMQSMVINVAANVSKFAPEDTVKKDAFVQQVRDFVTTEMANHEGQAGFVARVSEVAFDETAKTKIETSQVKAESEAKMQRIIAFLPIVALLLIGIMVVKQFGKMQRQTATIVTPGGQLMQVPLVNGQIPSHYALVNPANHQSKEKDAEPEPVSRLSQSLSRFSEDQVADGIAYVGDDEVIEVERIKEKKSAHLAAIKQMAKERPESTALLIKTWIADDAH
jgi:flagellar M-ring protein FliF